MSTGRTVTLAEHVPTLGERCLKYRRLRVRKNNVGYAAFSKQGGLYVSNGAITADAEDIAVIGLKNNKDRRYLITKQVDV